MKVLLTVMAVVGLASFSEVKAAGYGAAGCGLGSMVFDADEGFTQVFAATTNGTSGSQTFGISSGTSNCDTGGRSASSLNKFLAGNRNALENDIVRGEGEALDTFAILFGCEDTQKLGSHLKASYQSVFSAESSDMEVTDKLLLNLKKSPEVSCFQIG